jgi:hypothetical protein
MISRRRGSRRGSSSAERRLRQRNRAGQGPVRQMQASCWQVSARWELEARCSFTLRSGRRPENGIAVAVTEKTCPAACPRITRVGECATRRRSPSSFCGRRSGLVLDWHDWYGPGGPLPCRSARRCPHLHHLSCIRAAHTAHLTLIHRSSQRPHTAAHISLCSSILFDGRETAPARPVRLSA